MLTNIFVFFVNLEADFHKDFVFFVSGSSVHLIFWQGCPPVDEDCRRKPKKVRGVGSQIKKITTIRRKDLKVHFVYRFTVRQVHTEIEICYAEMCPKNESGMLQVRMVPHRLQMNFGSK